MKKLLILAFLTFVSSWTFAATHIQQGDTAGGCLSGTYPNPTFSGSCSTGSSGSSALAVTTGTAAGFSVTTSSPTAVVNADQAMFGVSLQGGATAFMTIKYATASVTTNTTLTSTHSVVLADASSGNVTVTLPTAANVSGRIYTVKRVNSGANTVTIATTSSQTIDADTTVVLTSQYTSLDIVSDGSNWKIL